MKDLLWDMSGCWLSFAIPGPQRPILKARNPRQSAEAQWFTSQALYIDVQELGPQMPFYSQHPLLHF